MLGKDSNDDSKEEHGDFWFNDLAKGKYDVVIETKEFKYNTFDAVDATIDVNFGDIAMDRKKGC